MLIRARRIVHGVRAWLAGEALWLPGGMVVPASRNVIVPDGRGGVLASASNLVTEAGEIRYTSLLAEDVPTNAFDVAELFSAGTPSPTADRSAYTVISGSEQGYDTGYPKVSDTDPNNPWGSSRTLTYKVTYTAGAFTEQAVPGGILTNATPGASEPVGAAWLFDGGPVTLPVGLPIFVNHPLKGV